MAAGDRGLELGPASHVSTLGRAHRLHADVASLARSIGGQICVGVAESEDRSLRRLGCFPSVSCVSSRCLGPPCLHRPLGSENLLLRGAKLKNTEKIFGKYIN